MGGLDDDEPPSKRVKASSLELGSLSNTSVHSEPDFPLGGSMARPLPSQGKDDIIGTRGVIKKVEFVRIITKALYSLGYEKTGAVLEEESGTNLHSPVVNLFRKHVLDGNWDESVSTLYKIGLVDENVLKSASFLILEQKFFELLESDRVMDALKTLRSEITPLNINKKRVHELCSCVTSPARRVLLGFANMGIDSSNSRLKLLEELQKLMPPTIMVPERRLEHLIEQALNVQREACYFHNSLDHLSLYTDHHCGKDQIPSWTTQILQSHQDEVWFVQFSNTGKYLASASNDKCAIIWEVHENGQLSLKHMLTGHQKPVLMVAWSPDDREILTCGIEDVVRRWDVASGECLHVYYEKNGQGLNSCGWFPDGRRIFTGVTDKSICLWDLDGKEVESWEGQASIKTPDVAITKDGKKIISMCKDSAILLLDRDAKSEKVIEEEQTVTSFSLSADDKFLLVNLVNQEIHLWSITDDSPQLVMRYKGHKRSRFVIRSCFGGFEQSFIASGSEDSQVYIWHRATGDLIEALPGHAGSVNCISWNPANPHMIASASDDHTVRIWGLKTVSNSNGHNKLKRKETYSNGVVHQCNGNSKC